ncbi:hypothetical protein F183_A43960 [Bryobacterales bacterium F-183]|nr:hypothetical protein F183_A43960 [Bryobacterales bacterium F-183]
MSYSWRSAEEYRSTAYPTVKYRISKMSMGRRLELTRRLRDLMKRLEFANAGTSNEDKMDAAILAGEIDRLYWEFAVESIEGIQMNGDEIGPTTQFELGPEDLSREILMRIKQQTQLTETERKN